jgi:hypothetical protein
VKQFEKSLVLTEERVAGKLQVQLRTVNANTLQVPVYMYFGTSNFFLIVFKNMTN